MIIDHSCKKFGFRAFIWYTSAMMNKNPTTSWKELPSLPNWLLSLWALATASFIASAVAGAAITNMQGDIAEIDETLSMSVAELKEAGQKRDEAISELNGTLSLLLIRLAKDGVVLAVNNSPLKLTDTGQKIADKLSVVAFIEKNYDTIVETRPNENNELDIQTWSRSTATGEIIKGLLGPEGIDAIKRAMFAEGWEQSSELAVWYALREVYGITLRDMIFQKELNKTV